MDSVYHASPTAQRGFGSSPVIHDGKVIVLCDVQKNSFIAALDIEDGRELWRASRQDVLTWGTPAQVQTEPPPTKFAKPDAALVGDWQGALQVGEIMLRVRFSVRDPGADERKRCFAGFHLI